MTACGIPVPYNASEEWADKKVVLFSTPGNYSLPRDYGFCGFPLTTARTGAFTPTCTVSHVPGFIQNLPNLRAKGIDIVAVIAFNDPWVMSAWGKANRVRGNDLV